MLCNNFLSLLPRKHQGQQRHRVCFADLPPMTLWVHIKLLIICKYISPLKRIHKHDFIEGGIENKVNLKIDNNKNNSLCKNKKTQIKILKRPDILFYYKKKRLASEFDWSTHYITSVWRQKNRHEYQRIFLFTFCNVQCFLTPIRKFWKIFTTKTKGRRYLY